MTEIIRVERRDNDYCFYDKLGNGMTIGLRPADMLYALMFHERMSDWTYEIKEIAEDDDTILTEEEVREANERIYDHICEMDYTNEIRAIINDIVAERGY